MKRFVNTPQQYVVIDFKEEAAPEITSVSGPFESEEQADQWDEATGQRVGKHFIAPLWHPAYATHPTNRVERHEAVKLDRLMSAVEEVLRSESEYGDTDQFSMFLPLDEMREAYRDATAVVADLTEGTTP